MIYKTLIVPLKCNKSDMNYMKALNKLSAQVWNECVKIDLEYQDIFGKSIGLSELQKATKTHCTITCKGDTPCSS